MALAFWLAGVNDVLSRTADLTETLRGVSRGEAVVLLAHEPDFADEASKFPIDLQTLRALARRPGQDPVASAALLAGNGEKICNGDLPGWSAPALHQCRIARSEFRCD